MGVGAGRAAAACSVRRARPWRGDDEDAGRQRGRGLGVPGVERDGGDPARSITEKARVPWPRGTRGAAG